MILELLVAILLVNDEPKKPAAPKQADPKIEPTAKLSPEDIKKLEETNIFAPYKKPDVVKPPKDPKPKETKDEPAKPQPKMLSVTGFFHDDQEKCFKVVIEDRTWDDSAKKYKFASLQMLKAGDEVAGGKIVEVRIDSFDHQVGEAKKTLKAGEQVELPGSVSSGPTKPPEGASTSSDPKPSDPKAVEDKLKELRDRHKGKKKFEEDPAADEMPGKKK